MMSESIDETLDKDEAEEETEELTNQVEHCVRLISVSSLSLSSFSPLTSTFVWLIYRFWMRLAWTLHHRLVPLRANTPHEFPRKIGFYFQQCYQVSDPGTCFQQLSSAPKGRIGSKKVENVVPRYVLHDFWIMSVLYSMNFVGKIRNSIRHEDDTFILRIKPTNDSYILLQ